MNKPIDSLIAEQYLLPDIERVLHRITHHKSEVERAGECKGGRVQQLSLLLHTDLGLRVLNVHVLGEC